MIAGLEKIWRGQIMIGARDATAEPPSKLGLAMVFRSCALYPHMSVRDNVGFPLNSAGLPRAEFDTKVDEAARLLKLDACLDAALRVEMRYEIAKLHQSLGTTMIYVTHDQVEAMTLADRIVVLEFGKIAQVGTPRELYETPANLFVAQFIGSPKMNVMPCVTGSGTYRLEGARGGPYPGDVPATHLGIRPEHITVGAAGTGACDGRVDVVEYLGADIHLVLDCGSLGQVTARIIGDTDLRPGALVGLEFAPDRLSFFGADGLAIRGAA
jgi:multiple sugar transport system ATP-binding protein